MTHDEPDSLSGENKRRILAATPVFAALSEDTLGALASHFQEQTFRAGDVILREGDPGDRLFVLASGTADIHAAKGKRSVFMKSIGPGDLFGELALLEPDGRRNATITATTPVRTLGLARSEFTEALENEPALRHAIVAIKENILRFRFLRTASPFGALDASMIERLSARLVRRGFAAGDDLIRQGDPGDNAFLVLTGRVEILRRTGAREEQIATAGLGTLLGEAAILTGEVRNATVRALEDVEAFEIDRHAILEMIEHDPRIGLQAIRLFRLREQPRHASGIEVHERQTVDGDTVRVLKRPRTSAYFQLSEGGWFIWEKLDGTANLRDITIAYMTAFKTFAPHVVADTIAGLTNAGFLEVKALAEDVNESIAVTGANAATRHRVLALLRRIFVWHWEVRGIDRLIGALYDKGGWLAYTVPGRAALFLIIVIGGLIVGLSSPKAMAALEADGTGRLLWLLVPMFLASIILHELGHGLTVKHYRREVLGAGIGCQGPLLFAFVNTSDMWLEGRGPRLVVGSAGLVVNMVLAGLAGFALLLAETEATIALSWAFAVMSWQIVLINLNPFFDLDGYHMLSDWVDKPNLRVKSFRRTLGLVRSRDLSIIRDHRGEIAYTALTLVYVLMMGLLLFQAYRPTFTAWLDGLGPRIFADLGALLIALLWCASSAAFLSRDFKRAVAAERGH